jgi:hypothetical protein
LGSPLNRSNRYPLWSAISSRLGGDSDFGAGLSAVGKRFPPFGSLLACPPPLGVLRLNGYPKSSISDIPRNADVPRKIPDAPIYGRWHTETQHACQRPAPGTTADLDQSARLMCGIPPTRWGVSPRPRPFSRPQYELILIRYQDETKCGILAVWGDRGGSRWRW